MGSENTASISHLRPWKPGQSGNPGGRPKIPDEVKEALKAATPRAVARLVELMESADERVAIQACNSILDRSIGKAPAVPDMDEPGPEQKLHLTPEQALAIVEKGLRNGVADAANNGH